jgi:hypothetical protein
MWTTKTYGGLAAGALSSGRAEFSAQLAFQRHILQADPEYFGRDLLVNLNSLEGIARVRFAVSDRFAIGVGASYERGLATGESRQQLTGEQQYRSTGFMIEAGVFLGRSH